MKRAPRRSRPASGKTLPPWLPPAEWSAAILLSLLALGLHVAFLLHAGALWRDEVNSVNFATMPSLSSIWHSLRYDSFPALTTLLLRGWVLVGLGHSDWGFRLFGFLTGIGLLGSLWITCRLLGCPAPLFSLTLVGLAPWAVRTAGSIRPYGLGMVWIVLTLGLLWRAVRSPTRGRFILAGVAATLSVQCMYQNALLIFAVVLAAALAAWWAFRPGAAIAALLVGVAAALTLLPYVPSVLAARVWEPVVETPIAARDVLHVLSVALGEGGSARVWIWAGLALVVAVVGFRALSRRPKGPSAGAAGDPAVFGLAVLILALLVFLLTVGPARLQTQPWYYVPVMALLAPVLDAGAWSAMKTPGLRMARLALVLALAGATFVPALKLAQERRTNVDAIASYLETNASPGDLIVVNPFWVGITFQRYYRGSCAWTTIPPIQDLRIHRFDLFKAAEVQPDPIGPVLAAMTRTLQSGHRLWVVGGLPEPRMDLPAPSIQPAPHPTFGWSCAPYLDTWGEQAAYYLMQHAMQAAPLPPVGPHPVSGYEDMALIPVSGWR